MITKKRYNRYK